ncbi:MAG: anthranilate synthase component I family protein [Bacteroidales bacterium]
MEKRIYTTNIEEILSDMHTPVSIYLKVRDLYPQSALLESSDYHTADNSRSFIALAPIAKFSVNHAICTTEIIGESKQDTPLNESNSVESEMNLFMEKFQIKGDKSESVGVFGYTAFDAIRYFENIPVMEAHDEDNDAPDIMYILYKYIIEIDHFRNKLTIIELLEDGESSKINDIKSAVGNRNYSSYQFSSINSEKSPITDEQYMEMVKQGIAHCQRGNTFQIVLSRRFEQSYQGDDFQVYRALRSINPSPYLFYFDFGGFRIFGSSPETHCRVDNGYAYIDPIAGTAFRSGDAATDKRLTEELLNDPKENAEHVMLVDLARNDLSRNATGVEVEFYKQVQSYSHVIHLVSRVRGRVDSDSNSIKTYVDTFPAGTLSGAPKVKAMQLITEIEAHNRGIYGGCIGFVGFNGALNQAIVIRTFVSRSNTLYYQAGAGIVVKSNPERELEEVNRKLGALKKAVIEAEKIQ